MKIFLTVQNLAKHLDDLKKMMVMNYNKNQLQEKITIQELNTSKRLDEINLSFLFNYSIFPQYIMSYKCEWIVENRSMKVGDTIAQQVYIPPIKYLSQKIVFGVRISEIINESSKIGFSYETLDGHVEKGISTFTIEEDGDKIIFKIHTFSKLGYFLSRLLGPLFSVPYQTFCTRKALLNVKYQIENQ